MIRAVVFDMFETLVTLFTGRTYFGEHLAADAGTGVDEFRKEWHATEYGRSTGQYTIEEALETVLKRLEKYSPEKVKELAGNRLAALGDTFAAIPEETFTLLRALKERGIRIGLITNTFSDERDLIRACPLFPYFDAALISYEQGICKPDLSLYEQMTRLLDVKPEECLYVGDGGSRELYAARDAGMHALQCTWFHHLAYEPHIPCPILDEFGHAARREEVLDFIDRPL